MKPSTHPRPQLERPHWQSLDGPWQFAFDDASAWSSPEAVVFDRTIEVPYPPESEASGVHDPAFHNTLWYRRQIPAALIEAAGGHGRLFLHFGAVDYRATVWANGLLVAGHEGGHTPFSADLSEVYHSGEPIEIVVRAVDDPHDLAQPRGKQDWELEPHDIWYPRTSGIWQPVWLESRPVTHITSLVWTASVERWEIGLQVRVEGHDAGRHDTGRQDSEPLRLRLQLRAQGVLLADDEYALPHAELARTIALRDAGIDIARSDLLWSPEHPQLIEASLELLQGGVPVDHVRSYTALRSVAVDAQHFLLNGRPCPLRLVLDQGYWPRSLMSASDEELRRDVELTRLLGFNGARKHQKIENPRWLYWCDVLGLLVWEELPSAYVFSSVASGRLTREWIEVIERDRSHPCIVAWVPFNESWGVPDLPLVAAQRDLVRAMYHLTRALDPTRPVIGNDGWEVVVSDILAIHDYTHEPEKLLSRYGTPEALETTLQHVRPHRRLLALDREAGRPRPAMLTEFGGIAYTLDEDPGWGYQRMSDAQSLQTGYAALLAGVHGCEGLAGFCYTQLTDTFQEKNGLLFADRTPKAELSALALATRGERSAQELEKDADPGAMGYSLLWRRKLAQSAAAATPPASTD